MVFATNEANTNTTTTCVLLGQSLLNFSGDQGFILTFHALLRDRDELGFEEVGALTSEDVGASADMAPVMGHSKHVFCEADVDVFDSTKRVVFIAQASIVWRSFGVVEVASICVALGTNIVVLVLGLETGPRLEAADCDPRVSGLLISKFVEVDLFAGDLAGLRVIRGLCDLSRLLEKLGVVCWRDILRRDEVFLSLLSLRLYRDSPDLLSWLLLSLRAAFRGLRSIHHDFAAWSCKPKLVRALLVVASSLDIPPQRTMVKFEMTAQIVDICIAIFATVHVAGPFGFGSGHFDRRSRVCEEG